MKAIVYNEKNYHDETCGFELYEKGKGIVSCGHKAHGQINRTPLCQEHFEHAVVMTNETTTMESEHVRRATTKA